MKQDVTVAVAKPFESGAQGSCSSFHHLKWEGHGVNGGTFDSQESKHQPAYLWK